MEKRSGKIRKKKVSFRDIRNNLYMIKMAFAACPSRVIGQFAATLLRFGVMPMFLSVTFLEKIVGYIETGAEFKDAMWFIIFSFLLLGSVNLFNFYYYCIIAPAGNQVIYEKLHLRMFEKATDVELECFENPDFYNKYTKATSQIKGKVFAVLNTITSILTYLFNISFLTYKAVTTDVYVLLFVLLPIIATYIIGVKTNKLSYKRYEENVDYDRTKEYVKRTVYLQDYAKELRLSNIFSVLMDSFQFSITGIIKNIKKYGVKLVLLYALQGSFNYSFAVGCTVCYAALRLFYFKTIDAADFIVLVSVITNFTWNVIDVAKQLTKIQDNSQYVENIKSFMDYEPKISESQPGLIPESQNLSLQMRQVSYTYFGQENPVLKDINFEIKPGQKIALVGHNGAGKTTLVKLLMRLYDVTEGEILLGEHNIKEYSVSAYRDLFGTVFQDYQVLSLSVAENVLMNQVAEHERDKVVNALKNSGIWEKVQTLPYGMDTTLTKEFDKEGAVLSGGEAQKIAIARVFAKDCDFVILDEPSSALDPIAEYQMYESMLKACEGKAVIFISHRLSSAVLADQIYLLEQGSIVERGTHQELMEKNGKYARMFEMQASNYQ